MKKRTKFVLGGIAAVAGALVLSGCTKSFCSNVDQGRMLYAFDPGITRYEAGGTETINITTESGKTYSVSNVSFKYAEYDAEKKEFYFSQDDKLSYLNSIISTANSAGVQAINAGTINYLKTFDAEVLKKSLTQALIDRNENVTLDLSNASDFEQFERDRYYYSYIKFVADDSSSVWKNWEAIDTEVRKTVTDPDYQPTSDFVAIYRSKMNSYISQYRSCLTTKTDKYGSYGYKTSVVYIEAKTWAYAWQRGFFEGLLVYPIGWLIDKIAFGFAGVGVNVGAAALLSILFVTLIVRSLMMIATIKQTAGNAKMTELQPEITKIQNKYPNANTSQVEKQRMAEEMNRLYKKNKINPLSSLVVMIIQFPVFICVWGALSGSAALSSGEVLNLKLSLTIREVLFTASNWWIPETGGIPSAVTALFLFLLMAGAQAVSMLLPQWMQKARAKKVAKTGKNPAADSQNNKMKWFTYIMLAMIIFMGFSLVSAMGVYWFVGALVSIGQTLIMQSIAAKRKKNN
ncbi:MAG: membrane protein insertase YidC [Bacilli bacterium]|nr:membrane protein insertase YidC [Bacilli bacterium]